MQIGIIGLGRMGARRRPRLLRVGHTVWGYDTAPDSRARLGADGGRAISRLAGIAARRNHLAGRVIKASAERC